MIGCNIHFTSIAHVTDTSKETEFYKMTTLNQCSIDKKLEIATIPGRLRSTYNLWKHLPSKQGWPRQEMHICWQAFWIFRTTKVNLPHPQLLYRSYLDVCWTLDTKLGRLLLLSFLPTRDGMRNILWECTDFDGPKSCVTFVHEGCRRFFCTPDPNPRQKRTLFVDVNEPNFLVRDVYRTPLLYFRY